MNSADDDVKREFFRKMGFCECLYCTALSPDSEQYVAHERDLQGLYPDGWTFTWCVSK